MARDYKSRANLQSGRRRHSPGWIWFIGGLFVGWFSAGLIWLKLTPSGQDGAGIPVAGRTDRTKVSASEQRTPPPPRFDFYTLLPEMEVVIPAEELQEQTKPATASSDHPEAKPEQPQAEAFLLQMGSFRKHADADRMKARLALLDIPVEIQKVTINNKDTFHRVRSGPYKSRNRVNELRIRLRQNSIQSMVIKLKP